MVGQHSPVKFLAAHIGFQAHSGDVVLDFVVVLVVMLSMNGARDSDGRIVALGLGLGLGLEVGRRTSSVGSSGV